MCKLHSQTASTESTLFAKFRRLGGQGAVYGLGTTLQRLAAFILLPIYTTVLTTSQFGVLELVIITGMICGTVFGLGLRSAMFRSVVDSQDDRHWRAVFSTALCVTAGSGLVLVALSAVSAPFLAQAILGDANLGHYFLLIMATTALEMIVQMTLGIFQIRQQPIRFMAIQTVGLLARITAIIYFVVFCMRGVEGVLLGQLYAIGGTVALAIFVARRAIVLRWQGDEAVKMIRYGAPLLFAGLFGLVSTYIDRYFLKAFTNADEVGVYSLAYRLGMIMVFVWIAPLKMAWGPMFLSVKDSPNFAAFCAKSMTYLLVGGGWLFLGVSLLSRELILIIADEPFHRAYPLVPVIAATYLLWSMRSILDVGVQIHRSTLWIMVYTGIGAVVNVALNIWWIPMHGSMGAAWATLVSFSCALLISIAANRRLIRIPYEFGRLLVLAVVLGGLFAAGFWWHPQSIVVSVAYKMGLLLAYPLILWLAGFIRREEWVGLGRILGGLRGSSS